MKNLRPLCAVSLAGLLLVGAGQGALKAFKPPRTAVVDISEVFEGYHKKRDRQDQFQAAIKGVEDKLKDLEKRYKDLVAELPNIEPGEKADEKEDEKTLLEMQVKRLKNREMRRLRDTMVRYLQEIRDEITREIQAYAEAEDLDLVVEKRVMAEAGETAGFQWPIVHFAKPELEITKEIAGRLNARYAKK
ncbi:MAG: OmpH family outer membrane protein [Planctomycetes bacterium]|nr:OmpH family outer membrane protein [Planctomycetota bacterium]